MKMTFFFYFKAVLIAEAFSRYMAMQDPQELTRSKLSCFCCYVSQQQGPSQVSSPPFRDLSQSSTSTALRIGRPS